MARGFTAMFPEDGWFAIVNYEPFSPDAALEPGTRQRLRDATLLIGIINMPTMRAVTFSDDQLVAIESWLASVIGQSDAPPQVRRAYEAVREAKRLPPG